MKKPIIIIPARIGSSRLDRKPLVEIEGIPLIVHVLRNAQSVGISDVFVATDDIEIRDVVEYAGGNVIVINYPAIHSGTDRIACAINVLDLLRRKYDIVINWQGDIFGFGSKDIDALLRPFVQPDTDISTVAREINNFSDLSNPNIVKVVAGIDPHLGGPGRAIYFNRSPEQADIGPHYQHLGLYAFTRQSLMKFSASPISVLEKRYRLEQLRALELGMNIQVSLIDSYPYEINTPEDLEKVRMLLGEGVQFHEK